MSNQEDYYQDGTHIDGVDPDISKGYIDAKSKEIASWLRSKKFGRDVREALARAVEWFSIRYHDIKLLSEKTAKRQSQVEERQTNVEGLFKDVIANATTDSEVILARSSDTFGKFSVLDDRFENIEKLVNKYIPIGFEFTIDHGLGTNPDVVVKTYDYAIGTEPNGFATEQGKFGGTPTKTLTYDVMYPDANSVNISLPFDYKMADGYDMVQSIASDNIYYLNEGIKTIKVELVN